jgi:uncharacterized membrane protein YuzA (DUF378 family)
MAYIGTRTLTNIATVVASIGGLNWGFKEFADTDVLIDTLGMTGDAYMLVIGLITAASVLAIYNKGVVDLLDDPLDG